jgi:NitT/TauT family transport system substrate-binding protein
MRRSTKKIATLMSGLTIATLLAGCGAAAEGDSADSTFRMGIQPWIGYGPWYVAEEQGYFADNDVNVELTNFNTDDQLNAALAGKKLDGANVATHTALKLISAGVPVTIVLLEDVSETADAIMASAGIDSISDLKGQKVAYEEGTTSDILLNYALEQNGMSIDDIEKVPLPASDAGSALIAGRVPVAVTYEPYLTTALAEDEGVKLLYTAGENPGIIGDVLIVRNDVIENEPEKVQALVDSWGESIDFYDENTKEAQGIIAKAVGATADELSTAFEGVKFYGIAENKTLLPGEYRDKTLQDVLDAARTAGIIEDEVDTSAVIDSTFVEAAKG